MRSVRLRRIPLRHPPQPADGTPRASGTATIDQPHLCIEEARPRRDADATMQPGPNRGLVGGPVLRIYIRVAAMSECSKRLYTIRFACATRRVADLARLHVQTSIRGLRRIIRVAELVTNGSRHRPCLVAPAYGPRIGARARVVVFGLKRTPSRQDPASAYSWRMATTSGSQYLMTTCRAASFADCRNFF